ncbi:FkbM family methyltransferase [Hoeflea sp. AS60]|uniref:FkbM family methyltransferase n=1 Tax=Hoeflea sp. AS60 TaxID=3135780 RepID=UPI00316D5FC4
MNFIYRQLAKILLDIASKEEKLLGGKIACFSHDIISQKIMIDGLFEKRELLAFQHFVRHRNVDLATCLDVGANIGNHSLFFARMFKKVVSFEPNDRTFRLLKFNSELADNVVVVNYGLSNRTAELPAIVDDFNIGGARIADGETPNLLFNVVALDSFLAENPENKISFIKIDVEGHELEALEGAAQTLRAHRPLLAMEMRARKHRQKFLDVLDLISRHGYETAHVIDANPFLRDNARFLTMSLSEFRNGRAKNHKMVLFSCG